MRFRLLLPFLLFPAFACCAFGEEDFRPLAELKKQLDEQHREIERLQERMQSQQQTIQELTDRIDSDMPFDVDGASQADPNGTVLKEGDSDDERINFLEALSAVARRTVNGRIHIDQWSHPQNSTGIHILETGDPGEDPDNELLYRRIRIGVKGKVPPMNMSYRLEIEHSGQDGSQFRDAWIGWDDLIVFQTLRLGNQKRPYGWDHLNSSNFTVFLERPFIVEAFNEDNRRFGLASYGKTDNLAFNWQYGVFYLPQVQDVGSINTERLQPEIPWRISNTWWYDEASNGRNYGHLGLSGTFAFPDGEAPNTDMRNNEARFRTRPEGRSESRWLDTGRIAGAEAYEILGIESVTNVGPLQVAGEYMNLWLQREPVQGNSLHLHGGYVYASYFLTGEYLPWDREIGVLGRLEPSENFFHNDPDTGKRALGIGAWQVAARLSYADLTNQDILGGIGQNATFALNWYWNAHSRMQVNYIIGRIEDRLAALNTGGQTVVSGDYQILGVRCMIDF